MTTSNAPRSIDELEQLSLRELKVQARAWGVPGRSKLNKEDLIDALLDAYELAQEEEEESQVGFTASGRSKLSALPVDTSRIHVRWTIVDLDQTESPLVLKIRDVTLIEFDPVRSHSTQWISIEEFEGQLQIGHLQAGRSYAVELGYLSDSDSFQQIQKAHVIRTLGGEIFGVRRRGEFNITRQSEEAREESQRAQPEESPTREPQSPVPESSSVKPQIPGEVGLSSQLHLGPPLDGSLSSFSQANSSSSFSVGVSSHEFGLSSSSLTEGLSSSEFASKPLIENVSSASSSSSSGRDAQGIDFKATGGVIELHADLVVYGKAQPNSVLSIEGQAVQVKPDGTFEVRFALKNNPPTN